MAINHDSQVHISAQCSILGFLVLHHHNDPKNVFDEQQKKWKLRFANWAAPMVNYRRSYDHSILSALATRLAAGADGFSCFEGVFSKGYTCCAGSYSKQSEEVNDIISPHLYTISQAGAPRTELRASLLTAETLKNGIKWLQGQSEPDQSEDQSEDQSDVNSVEGGLQKYIRILQKKVVSLDTKDKLMKFIQDREWSHCWGGERDSFLSLSQQFADDVEAKRYLRQYIVENLARSTKVVVWFVDGMHRASIAESLPNGVAPEFHPSNEELTNAVARFGQIVRYDQGRLWDGVSVIDQLSSLTIWYPSPGQNFDRKFVARMNDVSKVTQKKIQDANPHNILHSTQSFLEKLQFPTLEEGHEQILKEVAIFGHFVQSSR